MLSSVQNQMPTTFTGNVVTPPAPVEAHEPTRMRAATPLPGGNEGLLSSAQSGQAFPQAQSLQAPFAHKTETASSAARYFAFTAQGGVAPVSTATIGSTIRMPGQ